MPVSTPHNPVHEETEFWYDTKENALLYEVSITTGRGDAEADHHRARESGRLIHRERIHHDHYEPHGITFASPQTLGTIPFSQTVRDAQAGVTNPGTAPSTVSHFVEGQPELSVTDLDLKPVYNHSNCPDMIAGLYEPLLQESIRYDRTTYTFTAKGLIAAAGTAG